MTSILFCRNGASIRLATRLESISSPSLTTQSMPSSLIEFAALCGHTDLARRPVQ